MSIQRSSVVVVSSRYIYASGRKKRESHSHRHPQLQAAAMRLAIVIARSSRGLLWPRAEGLKRGSEGGNELGRKRQARVEEARDISDMTISGATSQQFTAAPRGRAARHRRMGGIDECLRAEASELGHGQ